MKRRQQFAIGDIVRDDDNKRGVIVYHFEDPELKDVLVVVRFQGERASVAVPIDLLRHEGRHDRP